MMEKKTKSAGTIAIPALFRQKTGLMDGYFFKVETIDWQSRRFRYIVKDAVFFSKKIAFLYKNTRKHMRRPAQPTPDPFS